MSISRNKLILLLGMICLEQSESTTLSLSKASNCGQSLVKVQPWNYFNIFSRILGGSQVEKGSYPWQVSLKRRQKHICGGTIISPRWVITAAHCVASRNIVSTLNVTAGEHDLSQAEPGEQTLTIETVIIHPHFSIKKPMNYDIALLKMAGAFQFDHFVRPICLPEPGERFKAGFICTTAGWGRLTEDGVPPQVLHEVNLPILTQKECVAALLTLKNPISGKTFLCTGFPDGGRDACQGDSGGSLMCRNKKGTWTVAGVTSWGLGCGRGWRNNIQKNDQGSPGIFTDLSKVLPWIYEHIQIGNRRRSSKAWCSEQDGVISGSEGKLYFPESLHLYYENKQLCVWTLLVPEEMHVLLSFFRLDVESCHHNYLSIYSLEDRLIGKFCGGSLPSSILVGSNFIRLKFISDGTDYATGFNLTYKALKPNYLPDSGCSSLAVLFEEGLIQSLNYPENNSDVVDCNWIFQAPKHHLIKLSFQSLEVEESGDCTSDYVVVHSDVERKKEIARLCGYVVPTPVLSPSSVMLISFQSENGTFSGFQATVSFVPEAVLPDLNISISENESMYLETWDVPTEEVNASDCSQKSCLQVVFSPSPDSPVRVLTHPWSVLVTDMTERRRFDMLGDSFRVGSATAAPGGRAGRKYAGERPAGSREPSLEADERRATPARGGAVRARGEGRDGARREGRGETEGRGRGGVGSGPEEAWCGLGLARPGASRGRGSTLRVWLGAGDERAGLAGRGGRVGDRSGEAA
ncbi:ovochymase-2 [Carlito syrichta]|uniref:Ovochymase-2 n=1 Tax=Carlito syrichta TaxID=1868482 RepID=A0A1U7U6K5_CARSF|nr:ovochymase-2 [Carlito syrichta]